jgi:transmembrane sensor
MTEQRQGERLFRAWQAASPPSFDKEAGRARFLERFAAERVYARRRYIFAAAAAALIACAVAMNVWRATSAVSFNTSLGEGRPGAWLATTGADELPLTFSEGSQLVMAPDSRGRVEELRRGGASFLLERGRVRARVTRRSNADWRFLAGPFEVRVIGTALRVQWDPVRERFAIRVDEGSVSVRGPNVGDALVVHAGEQCVVDLPTHTSHMGPSSPDARTNEERAAESGSANGFEAPATSWAPPTPAPASPVTQSVSWLKLEEKGAFEAAYDAASSVGLASILRSSSADDLLRLAQVARLSGHRDTERDALTACRHRYPGSERAAVAAYELGQSSPPNEASSWFDTYLREQPNGSLSREALGRLIEARVASGDDRGARDAATRYLARYPGGPHVPLARRVLSGARD